MELEIHGGKNKMTEEEIIDKCTRYRIKNYIINDDMTIDVDDDVNLWSESLVYLPLNFGKVTGSFNCSRNKLTTLEGCPNYVGGYFNCSLNKLTTLEGCTKHIENIFNCSTNNLTSFQGLPVGFYIGGSVQCYGNDIADIKEYGKLFFGTIGEDIYIGDNLQTATRFLNENKNPPKKDLPRLLSELRKIKI